MRLGYKRDYEVDAICDFAQIVKMVAFDHPEDAALQAYCSKVKMTAIMSYSSSLSTAITMVLEISAIRSTSPHGGS